MRLGSVKPGVGQHIKADERQIRIYNTVEKWKREPGLERAGMRRYLYETHKELGVGMGEVGAAHRYVKAGISDLARTDPDLLAQFLDEPPDVFTRYKEAPAPQPAGKGDDAQIMAGEKQQQPTAHVIAPIDPSEPGQRELRIRIQQPARPPEVEELEGHLTKALEAAERIAKGAQNTVQVGLLSQALDRAEAVIRDAFQALDGEFNPLKARSILEAYQKAPTDRFGK